MSARQREASSDVIWDGRTGSENDYLRAEGKTPDVDSVEYAALRREIIATQKGVSIVDGETKSALDNLHARIAGLPDGDDVRKAYERFSLAFEAGRKSDGETLARLTNLVETLLQNLAESQKQTVESARESAKAITESVRLLAEQTARRDAITSIFPADTPVDEIHFWIKAARAMPQIVQEKFGVTASEFMALGSS